jgi:hypothetical protein
MNTDTDKGGGRLWGGRDQRTPQPDEKVVPLKAPAETNPAGTPPVPHGGAYVAFEVLQHAQRLHIVMAAEPSEFPGYPYLLNIHFDQHQQSGFTLIYTFMVVQVTGRNLWPVVHAINLGNCALMREYHPKLYSRPPAGDEPFIEKIHIIAADEK